MQNDGVYAGSKAKRVFAGLIGIVIIAGFAGTLTAQPRLVPAQYRTIQDAIDDAVPGDEVILAPGVYSLANGNLTYTHGPADQEYHGLNFAGKAITLRSAIDENAPVISWATIESTIIDLHGGRHTYQYQFDGEDQFGSSTQSYNFYSRRAFDFSNGEGNATKIVGITIRNGYFAGAVGQNALNPGQLIDPENYDPNDAEAIPWSRAARGESVAGDGYGGAALCNGSSPTFKLCRFINNQVSGGQGGFGADGKHIPPGSEENGQWGGNGGHADGNGYGGAIACQAGAAPIIEDCIFEGNTARGAVGGDGGNGSENDADTEASHGGVGGAAGAVPDPEWPEDPADPEDDILGAPQIWAVDGAGGDGRGGAIYCEAGSVPIINGCTFKDNKSIQGSHGIGGERGNGSDLQDPFGPATKGPDGWDYAGGAYVNYTSDGTGFMNTGGTIYCQGGSTVQMTNCSIDNSQAYYFSGTTITGSFGDYITKNYTRGGAIFIDNSGITANFDNVDFYNSRGGAVFADGGNTLNFTTANPDDICEFAENVDTFDGAAIFLYTGGQLNLTNCSFSSNTARMDGGAIRSYSNINAVNCAFGSNTAQNGWGGAIEIYDTEGNTELDMEFQQCIFSGNRALWGGAIHTQEFHAEFSDCRFYGNMAESGGALYLSNGVGLNTPGVLFDNCDLRSNIATDGDEINIGGGAIAAAVTALDIRNSTIQENMAEGDDGFGGGIMIYGGDPTIPQTLKNCLVTQNVAAQSGGGIAANFFAEPDIELSTFADNYCQSGNGGAVYSELWGTVHIENSIFFKNDDIAVYEGENGIADVDSSLFYGNKHGDFGDFDPATYIWDTLSGAAQVNGLADNTNNIEGDPLFMSGPLNGDYYLSQIEAGQSQDSPAVNAGNAQAAAVGMDFLTTRTDGEPDSGTVDMGYHYGRTAVLPTYRLYITTDGHGSFTVEDDPTVYDSDNPYDVTGLFPGTWVKITAIPDAAYRLDSWEGGTVDDSSTKAVNYVIIGPDKFITIRFEQPRTLHVGPDSDPDAGYHNIQDAVHNANDGDVIIVEPGTWFDTALQIDKNVLITSTDPSDPAIVAATIIERNGNYFRAIDFGPNVDRGCVLDGFTIQNSFWKIIDGADGDSCVDGGDGGSAMGGSIFIYPGASPVIRNCIIQNNGIQPGHGGRGGDSTDTCNAGRGGWSGYVFGGAIYCGEDSAPLFVNCKIRDNYVRGSNGGNGGNKAGTHSGNYGGNWSRQEWWNILYDRWEWTDGNLWEAWGYQYPPKYRGAFGGAVFCDERSEPTFIECEITGNHTYGGHAGQGGSDPWIYGPQPEYKYEMDTFGGAVFCAEDSRVSFTKCLFSDNIAKLPDEHFYVKPYLGYGGAICAEKYSTVVLTDCELFDNQASIGGAIYWASNANVILNNCDIHDNFAFEGGGLSSINSTAQINSTIIENNTAVPNLELPDQWTAVGDDWRTPPMPETTVLFGKGGGFQSNASIVSIYDSIFTGNETNASGGAIYFGGSDSNPDNTSLLSNCLIYKNRAALDGGAVSINWFSEPQIENCTITDNMVYGFPGYGGAVSAAQNSSVNIIDSILWNNTGANGAQIALRSTPSIEDPCGYDATSSAFVTYSDVEIIKPASKLDIVFCFDTTGSMTADIAAFQAAAVEILNQLADLSPDFRVAVMDYHDYPDDPTVTREAYYDYIYRDLIAFNSDIDATIAAVENLDAFGGNSSPEEAVYTALIHAIDHSILVEALTANDNEDWLEEDMPGPGPWRTGPDVRRVVLLLGDRPPHDPENYTGFTFSDLVEAATGNNPVSVFTVPIRGETDTVTAFEEIANATGGILIPAETPEDTVDAIIQAISVATASSSIYMEDGCVLNQSFASDLNQWFQTWAAADYISWFTESHNLNADPLFVDAENDVYLLSQGAAGQLDPNLNPVINPVVDAGSDDAVFLDLDTYTTRTDSVPDQGIVDMGYHEQLFEPDEYELIVELEIDPNIPADFADTITVSPMNGIYSPYTTVVISATPIPEQYEGQYQINWIGADGITLDDPSMNYVNMNADRTVTVVYRESKEENFALFVAIDDYDGTINDLPYSVSGAMDLADAIAESKNWSFDDIEFILDSQATKANIEQKFIDLAAKIGPEDTFVFYFGGHGTTGPDQSPEDEADGLDEYLVTRSFENISDDELTDWFGYLNTDKYIVILDNCFSGGSAATVAGTFVMGIGNNKPAPGDGFKDDFNRMAGTVPPDLPDLQRGIVITGTSEDQFGWQFGSLGSSVFTYYLTQGLKTGLADDAANANSQIGWISIEELYEFAAPRTSAFVADFPNLVDESGNHYQQDPQISDFYNGDLDFIELKQDIDKPKTVTVPGDYPDLESAVNSAGDGDTIIVSTGSYGSTGERKTISINKDLVITGENPDDVDIINATLIQTWVNIYAGADVTLQGLSFTRGSWHVIDGRDGEQPDEDNPGRNRNGADGGNWNGGIVNVGQDSSAAFRNCIFRDTFIRGGHAGNGAAADENNPGGDGGDGGAARGGAVYVGTNSTAEFIGCRIQNCTATGGNGGNGGDGAEGDTYWQPPGEGGLYYVYEDYRFHSGYGGGVYCDENTTVRFVDTEFIDCAVYGGMSGVGGAEATTGLINAPHISYEIPTYGGAVYCAENSNVDFKDCFFQDNVSVTPSTGADNQPVHTLNPYIGHGGGVAFEGTTNIKFEDCRFVGNSSSTGGGVYWADSRPQFNQCSFSNNNAFQGGAMFGSEGAAIVKACHYYRNRASVMADDPVYDTLDIAGRGAAIYLSAISADVYDCNILENTASASGGGIYITGSPEDQPGFQIHEPYIKNNLFVNNAAGRDGGAISVNWYAEPVIELCTMYNNEVRGSFGPLLEEDDETRALHEALGGGVYCSYDAAVTLRNSILWNNLSRTGVGNQAALYTGYQYDPENPGQGLVGTSEMTIEHSVIQGGAANILVAEGCTLNYAGTNINQDPLFVYNIINPQQLDNDLIIPYYSFYLSNADIEDQSVTSPCVNAGSVTANQLQMNSYTTRTDSLFDRGVVDIGFHYPIEESQSLCRYCDVGGYFSGANNYRDGEVNYADYVLWAQAQANYFSCTENNDWCNGVDFNFDGKLDQLDAIRLGMCWLEIDDKTPLSNPPKWAQEPNSIETPLKVVMQAEAAYDQWGWPVVYQFYRYDSQPAEPLENAVPSRMTPWAPFDDEDDPRVWEDTNVVFGNTYWYSFRVREVRPDGNGIITDFAKLISVKAGMDEFAPVPTWNTRPEPITDEAPFQIFMSVNQANDPEGSGPLLYQFECIAINGNYNNPGNISPWLTAAQDGLEWTDTGLVQGNTYTYVARTRDTENNVSEDSQEATATAGQLPDQIPPNFGTAENPDYKARFAAGYPQRVGSGPYYDIIQVAPATDDSVPIEYLYTCSGNGCPDALPTGWTTSSFLQLTVPTSTGNAEYTVTARDSAEPNPNVGETSNPATP